MTLLFLNSHLNELDFELSDLTVSCLQVSFQDLVLLLEKCILVLDFVDCGGRLSLKLSG